MAVPANPNDGSLLSSVFISADERAHDQAKDMLALFGLPAPQEREFFIGQNADRLYLNRYGLCLSFVYRHTDLLKAAVNTFIGAPRDNNAPVFAARKLVDERILQPLLQVDLSDNCCLEVLPGVQTVGVSKEDVARLAKILKAQKINFYSQDPYFVGLVREPESEKKVRVVINRRAIKPMSGYTAEDEMGAGVQDLVYGGLREEFSAAFQKASGQAMVAVLKTCGQIAALPASDTAKILHANWLEPSLNQRRRSMADAAQAYSLRLMQ